MNPINESNLITYSQKFSNIVRNNNNKLNENTIINQNNFEQISLKNNIIKPDYKGANIISFLSFLNNTICLPQNLRIVCHSHIMQKLISDLNILPTNNIINILKENLWSIFMSLNNGKKISISRHGFSFANLIKEKKKSFYGKYEQIMEKDAKLSLYGILTALLHGSDLVEKEYKYGLEESPQTIFVSVLIRTWMTAVCLYLPHCEVNNFTLVVSPFIKEKGIGLDNEPDSFQDQLKTMGIFLNYLIKISDVTFSKKIINENLFKIKDYFINNPNKLIVYNRYPGIMYGEKIIKVEFSFNPNLKEITYNYLIPSGSISNNYFKGNCTENKTFNIKDIEIFHGEIKPLKENIKTKFTRWCEPFSSKSSFSNTKSLCKNRLSKNISNTENTVLNNNTINLTPREAIYKRPNKNLNFLNLNNPSNNNNIRKYLEEENQRKKSEQKIINNNSNNSKKLNNSNNSKNSNN